MLANIYLKQNELKPTKWNEDLLAQENIHRGFVAPKIYVLFRIFPLK
jgi:hypothetical protein